MARRKTKNAGCLVAIIVIPILVLITYLIQMPKGPEVPYAQSVSDNHQVYFDAVTVSLVDSRAKEVYSRTRRTVRTGTEYTSIYRCTTADGQFVMLHVVRNTLDSSNSITFDSKNAAGNRIHGVKVGDGPNAYVRFEKITPRE